MNEWIKELIKSLRETGRKIVTVESCTGGGIANAITDIEGASDVLEQAYVVYSNEAKVALGVPQTVIELYGVYSVPTAVAMARQGMELSLSSPAKTVSIGVTGSLGRVDPANGDSVPDEVHYAIIVGTEGSPETFSRTIHLGAADRPKAKAMAIGCILRDTQEMLDQL